MTIKELRARYFEDARINLLKQALENNSKRIHLNGLCGSAESFAISGLFRQAEGTFLVILQDHEDAAYVLNDLENLNPDKRILYYPSSYKHPYKAEETENTNVQLRAEALSAISKDKSLIIVTYPEALSEKVVTKVHLNKNSEDIQRGAQLSVDFLNEFLHDFDFERVDFVYEPGQFSIRGGIIDIFSFSNDHPYRIELFGDEVDSIRTFDPVTQLSLQIMDTITIVPNVQTKLLQESRQSFFEFIPNNTVVWLRDVAILEETVRTGYEKALAAYAQLEGRTVQLTPEELFLDGETLYKQLLNFSLIEFGNIKQFKAQFTLYFKQNPQPSFNKNFNLLDENLKENDAAGYSNLIASSNAKQVERLYRIFEDIDSEVHFYPVMLPLKEGFIDHELKIACYTDHQIFERYHRYHLKENFKETKQAITLKELLNLQPGDFVTHIDHGVGKFGGLEKIDVNGKLQEAIRLIYKEGDVLYVNIHSLHRIAKYTGKEGTTPSLNKLGTKTWANLKQKTKARVKELAYDLIQLYAKRKATKGHAYQPDSYLQHELEASFMYEDTPDQLKATQAVKEDMEKEAPMDRLVCGDVGFGKTEIAIRAAFKAVCDSKQVAVLVPTTVLALQHYKTFKKRLADFPCKVDYINRFKSAKEQKETLERLADGKVDIIIGTHRLTGKDIKFKDLGLLIIDEEQKFGVSAKDKLKTLRANVDSLTLTATPIPRTLQFSMMGARDLSVINTPPPNRHPVHTEVRTFSEELVRDAIYNEVSRGGQAFFVHNRVSNIKEIAGMINRLCPEVKVAIAHGQMEGDKLEKVMMDFVDGEYDVLVATTIIESGLDISNANTMIINDAQNFGLSDLHQMRGRVGRSNKKAYCYLLTLPSYSLSEDSRKRLQAIEQFSDLGSGFQVAMRDLDIRGAGDLLGGEQSGFISEIGYETYQKILDEAIRELKENDFKDVFTEENQREDKVFVQDCQIDTDLEIMIPDDYINNITERLSIYKEMSDLTTEAQLDKFKDQLKDRFGPIPKQTAHLFDVMRLQWIAKRVGIEKLVLKSNKLLCYFVSNPDSAYYQSKAFGRVLEYVKMNARRCQMKQKNDRLMLTFESVYDLKSTIKLLEPMQGQLE